MGGRRSRRPAPSPAGGAAGEERPFGPEPRRPPDGYRPDLRRGSAWCPYCGEEREFAWDAETGYARCPGCGISSEDFHTKSANGLWGRAAALRFEAAAKASGRRFSFGGGKA